MLLTDLDYDNHNNQYSTTSYGAQGGADGGGFMTGGYGGSQGGSQEDSSSRVCIFKYIHIHILTRSVGSGERLSKTCHD